MKIKTDYVLRSVAGHHIIVPVGQEAINFNGIITLNNSGKLLFEALLSGEDKQGLIKLLMNTYAVEENEAKQDVEAFIKTLESKNVFK